MDKLGYSTGCEIGKALLRLEDEIREGLQHGFFDMSVSCEVIKDGKRRLTIRSGKSYQFVIAEQELRRHFGDS